jgi:hypothetical protein
MKSHFILVAWALAAASPALAESPVGQWRGTVAASEGEIPVSATISMRADGQLTGTAQSVRKKGGAPMEMKNLKSDGTSLSFQVPDAEGGFSGEWRQDKNAWVGFWGSSDGPLEMVLSRAK